MVSQHLHDITEMDMMSLNTGGYEWINFTPRSILAAQVTLTSCAPYRIQKDPKVHMGVKREVLFKSLLNKLADELLTGARIFVAQKDEERVEHLDGRIKGLPGNIGPTKPPKKFKDTMGRDNLQE